jgi:hypothetical protein
MSRAGHSSYQTTKLYVDLSGERFREEAERLEGRLWGRPVPRTGTTTAIRCQQSKRRRPQQRLIERRGWDSNPRGACTPNGFQECWLSEGRSWGSR